jgi:peptidoglycan hydrolase-like protein with peptidoglycan-binding domain
VPSYRRRSPVLTTLLAVLAFGGGAATAVPVAAAKPAKHLGDRSLRLGLHGPDVRELQRYLRKVGIKTTVDGQFGAGTAAAVRRFQRAAHLEPSGMVGPKTAKRLLQAVRGGAAQYTAGGFDFGQGPVAHKSLGDRIPLRRGMSGHDVKVLQDFLRRSGFRTSVDGQFGTGTWRTVRRFERSIESEAVDGVVDANDIAALRQLAGGGKPEADEPAAPLPLAPGDRAQLTSDGLAMAPASAPPAVKAMIDAGNRIAKKPYIYGGGHGKWEDRGYDCSGSVSYALHGAGLLKQSMPSGGFTNWGDAGPGQWVTIYANSGHMYMVVAGLRFDTSGARQTGSRWQKAMRTSKGYVVRHPAGL